MKNKKSHILLNANIRDLSTSVLCVLEYDNINIFPSSLPVNMYVVSRYDEDENTTINDFSIFPNLKNETLKKTEPFENFLEVERWMEELNYDGLKSSKIEMDGYEISSYLNKKYNLNIDPLDVEIDHLLQYTKETFYVTSVEEYRLRRTLHTNPFSKPLLNNLLSKRKEDLEKYNIK